MKINRLYKNTNGVRGEADPIAVMDTQRKKRTVFKAKFKGGRGETHEASISLGRKDDGAFNKKDFMVHCTCDDYKFTFYPAIEEACLNMKQHKFDGTSAGTGRIRHVEYLGMCKHLRGLWKSVKKEIKK
ncbi:hypothetical protein GR11A_00072 [Vibrio phage vB_VcorM_GR11A]|nr:hypothetical protein GR11A_00072 [Vibrio phage vB_VcorM_GR11A]